VSAQSVRETSSAPGAALPITPASTHGGARLATWQPRPTEEDGVRAFAHSIVTTIRQPLLLLDDRSVVRYANPAFYRAFGLAERGTVGRVVFEIDNGRWDVPAVRGLVADVQAGGSFAGFELRQEVPTGERVMTIDARQVRDDDGATMSLLAIDDATTNVRAQHETQRLRLELEARVKERTADLETSNKELEAFSYSVSHDLRAPLRAIDGFSAQLLELYADRLDERGQHYLRRVRAATLRMSELIDDLLQLSRLSQETLRCERIDLTALSTSIANELRLQDPERRVSFESQPGLESWGDPGLIKIAVQNLIGNAWKFTGATATATIAIGRTDRELGNAYFVRDNGAGFDKRHADNLFGVFQRLHPQRQFPGHGIGLALVQRVIHRHGGRVWAEGSPGHGATFFFTLPGRDSP
jgi:signal transduction histidine kinase